MSKVQIELRVAEITEAHVGCSVLLIQNPVTHWRSDRHVHSEDERNLIISFVSNRYVEFRGGPKFHQRSVYWVADRTSPRTHQYHITLEMEA